jgi:dsRNA-specific ribonuclease
MRPERRALAEQVAAELFGGNLSELLDEGIDALIQQRAHRDALIANAITSMIAADRTDSAAAEHEHLLLAALFGEGDARAIENVLQHLADQCGR